MVQRVSHREEEDRPGQGEIDLRALGQGLWRRRMQVIVPTVLVAICAVAFVGLSSPYYRSSALILIENREGAGPRGDRALTAQLPDEQAVASQVQLIQSRDLVRAVVKNTDLASDPEFGVSSESIFRKVLRLVGLVGEQDPQPLDERVVDKVAGNLSVYPVVGTRVVGVEFSSHSADLAAKVVNGFIDAYLAVQRDAKRESNQQASQYLADEIASLRGRVAEAEDRVEAFRAQTGLVIGTNNTTVAAQQLGDTTIQLSAARTQQGEAQAKADMIRSVMSQGRPAEALDIANSELVRALTQQRSQLAAQLASEGRTLLPLHPRMRELSAQIAGLDAQIRNEAANLARAFENDARTAGARVEALSKQFDLLKKSASSANGQEVQLRALDREARSQRDLLEQMLTRYREAAARDNPEALLADARVISRGAAATEPYFPKKGPTVILATIGAFVLALFAAAVAEIFGGASIGRRRADDSEPAESPKIVEHPSREANAVDWVVVPTPASTVVVAKDAGEVERESGSHEELKQPIATSVEEEPVAATPIEPSLSETAVSSEGDAVVVAKPDVLPEAESSNGHGSKRKRGKDKSRADAVASVDPDETPVEATHSEAPKEDAHPAETVVVAAEPAEVIAVDAISEEPLNGEANAEQTEAEKVADVIDRDAEAFEAAAKADEPVQVVSEHASDIEFADATLVAALARQLANMPSGSGALRILMTGAAEGLETRSVASELASTISTFGRRVIAVDVGGGVAQEAMPGLAELLSGEATFAQAIHRDPGSRVHIVPRGAQRFAALDAGAQARLGVVLEALALTYDFVVLHAQSGAGRADAFADHCTAAVLISNTGAADAVTIDAHERLRGAGIEDVVVLLVNAGGGSPDDKSLAA